jgi:hypothetical protein
MMPGRHALGKLVEEGIGSRRAMARQVGDGQIGSRYVGSGQVGSRKVNKWEGKQ